MKVELSAETILILLFSTWIFTTIVIVAQAQNNTEQKMRIERLEDEIMGINMPLTHTIKPALKEITDEGK